MKSVGDVMAIGRSFPEVIQKAVRRPDLAVERVRGALWEFGARARDRCDRGTPRRWTGYGDAWDRLGDDPRMHRSPGHPRPRHPVPISRFGWWRPRYLGRQRRSHRQSILRRDRRWHLWNRVSRSSARRLRVWRDEQPLWKRRWWSTAAEQQQSHRDLRDRRRTRRDLGHHRRVRWWWWWWAPHRGAAGDTEPRSTPACHGWGWRWRGRRLVLRGPNANHRRNP